VLLLRRLKARRYFVVSSPEPLGGRLEGRAISVSYVYDTFQFTHPQFTKKKKIATIFEKHYVNYVKSTSYNITFLLFVKN